MQFGRREGWLAGWDKFGLAALSGCLYFLGFCGFGYWALSWICLVPALWALDDETLSGRRAFAIAWIFGWVTYLGGYWWIVEMFQVFGGLPAPLAYLGLFLHCAFQGLLLGIWGWTVHRVGARGGRSLVWVAPAAMVAVESGFPSIFPSYLSNSQYRWIELVQSLDVWGPAGLSFLVCLGSAAVYATLAWRFRSRRFPVGGWVFLGLLLTADLVYGGWAAGRVDRQVAESPRKVKIGIVQANLALQEKQRQPRESLDRHQEQSRRLVARGADLLVWPEGVFFVPISTQVRDFSLVQGDVRTPLVFGGIRLDAAGGGRKLFNTAFAIDSEGRLLGAYDKNNLLVFGEYLPFSKTFPGLHRWFPYTSRFEAGTGGLSVAIDGVRCGVLICYEDLLPGFVREVLRGDPDLLLNLTDDAWFGRTREPLIHLAMASFRAVEQRRFLVRATNTGISAFIDPAGRILDPTPIFERTEVLREVALLEGKTVYFHAGEWFGWVCLLALIAGVAKGRNRAGHARP